MPNRAVDFHSEHVQEFARKYDVSRDFKARLRVWTRLIATCAGPDIDVIDVGCGVGTFSFIAASLCRSVIGVDASEKMIEEARRRGDQYQNVTFQTAYLETLPESHDAFGLVLCSSVIEYLDDFEQGMDALTALTAPGGHLIVSIPNARSLYRVLEGVSYRVVRRPAYFGLVRNLKSVPDMRAAGAARGLRLREYAHYGPGLARTLLVCVFSR